VAVLGQLSSEEVRPGLRDQQKVKAPARHTLLGLGSLVCLVEPRYEICLLPGVWQGAGLEDLR